MSKYLCPRFITLLAALAVLATASHAQGPVDYAAWHLEWAEEFNEPLDTAALAERWHFYYPWGRALNTPLETGYYTGRELHVANGNLLMTMHKLDTAIAYRGKSLRYTTPMLISRHPADSLRPSGCNPAEGFSYGLFEVRARQPRLPTAAPAFWLFGGAPDEIDVFEGNADAIASNFHLAPSSYWRPSRRQELACQCTFYNADVRANLHDEFHTYGVSWLPNGVVFYYDGIPIRHETRLVPAGCAMSVIVNMAALAWANQPVDTLTIDYIRVYRPRQLPAMPPALRQGAYYPETEQAWLPAETQPGRPDQATHQSWLLASQPRSPRHLNLQLTDNYNPPCELTLPLPVAGHWAPAWYQTWGMPELRVAVPAADSVSWTVRSITGELVAQGQVPGGGTWQPRWPPLASGTYMLYLRQGDAAAVHRLSIAERPAGSAPTPAWRQPVPAPTQQPE